MADRVHPSGDSPLPVSSSTAAPVEKPQPLPGTYVIQVPKDQVYRVPPPENARRYEKLQKRRRNSCCCCLSWFFGIIILLILALAATAGILYLVFRPKIPNYSVESLSISGFNLSDLGSIRPVFDVRVRSENPNKKIGIYYESGSSVTIFYSNIELCSGVLPVFYQGTRNVTVFQTTLTGEVIRLSNVVRGTLVTDQQQGRIPLELDLKVPIKVKFGAVKTWKVTVDVRCALTVDKLGKDSKLLDRSCDVKLSI